MNATTVLSVTNFTPHVFFEKFWNVHFFMEILILHHSPAHCTSLGPICVHLDAQDVVDPGPAYVTHQQLRTKITLENENPWIFAKVMWIYILAALSIVAVFIRPSS